MLLEGALNQVDGARRTALGWALSIPSLRTLLVDKDRRVAVLAVLLVTSAAVVAIGLPVVPLLVAPLVLGIPHLLSEARWLVVRARVPRTVQILLAAAALTLAGLALAREPGAECALGLSCIALALAWRRGGAGGARGRSGALLALVPGAGAVACALNETFACGVRDALIASHALVTIGVWILLWRRGRRFAGSAAAAVTCAVAGVGLLRGPLVALAFLASVHYAVWLVLVPTDAARGAGMLTFRMSVAGWRKDLGGPVILGAAAACALLVTLVVVWGAAPARDFYLVAARFHLWLEVAMACVLLKAGRRAAAA